MAGIAVDLQASRMRRRIRGCIALMAGCATASQCLGHVFTAPTSRRDILGAGVLGTVAGIGAAKPVDAYDLIPLPYAYNALEPSIDKATMEFHHDKHHNTYVTNINKAFEGKDQPPLVDLQKTAIKDGPAFRNSGGGTYNHNFFWLEMAPTGTGGEPSVKLREAIKETWGSFDTFKEKFEASSAPGARFGSGWVWLIVKDGKLEITSTPNQDNPLMDGVEGSQGIPILGLDVWEHAYYLKYQWNRPSYVKNWWYVVNWRQISQWYEDALAGTPPSVDGNAAAAAMVGVRNTIPKSPASFGFKFNIEANAQFGN